MLPKLPYIIYFVALLVLVLPSFILKNNKLGVFIKNMSIWGLLFILIIFIFTNFNFFLILVEVLSHYFQIFAAFLYED